MTIIIDGKRVQAEAGEKLLDVARRNNVEIPTLCYLKNINNPASCRMCVVEISGKRNLMCACTTTVWEGMEVKTKSPKVIASRKKTLQLLLSAHDKNCDACDKNGACQLKQMCEKYGVNEDIFGGEKKNFEIDSSSPCIVRNNNRCILCGNCVAVCDKMQHVSALSKVDTGFNCYIGCGYKTDLKNSTCVGCGQCTLSCPTGALSAHNSIDKVRELLKSKTPVIAQIAPSVRVSFLEEFGYPIGTFNEGKLVGVLKALGFDKVFDINMGADFTVVEEANELVERIKTGKNLPQFSSCCPAWFKYVQTFYKDYVKNLSTCKSPSEMLGSIVKNYYAKAKKIKDVKVVAIMPCTAKKGEIERAKDVDAVITTRELAEMVRDANIDIGNIDETKFDHPLGTYSGAGLIFGATGGVTEAVLRTAVEKISGKDLTNVDFDEVRYSTGVKEVSLKVNDLDIKIAIVNGLANANKIMQDIIAGKKKYHFVEVMACPGGCINGGGQPLVDYSKVDVSEVIKRRTACLYDADSKLKTRKSHKNADVVKIYQDFFIKEKGLSHKLLHWK